MHHLPVSADGVRLPTTAPSAEVPAIPRSAADKVSAATLPSITMTLSGTPISDAARLAVQALAGTIFVPKGNRRRPSAPYLLSLAAIVADLLNAASYNPARSCYCPLNAGAFSGRGVGYHPTRRALGDLARHGLILIDLGRRGTDQKPGKVTRIDPTEALAERLASFGILPADRLLHFSHKKAPPPLLPIRLKAGSTRGEKWKKIPGKVMKVDASDPKVAALIKPVAEINAFMAGQNVTLDMAKLPIKYRDTKLPDDLAFFRSFNCGDVEDYSYDKGGRLTCLSGHYQMIHKECRPAILINDLETVEIDVSSCHLTIGHALLGRRLPDRDELYQVGDLDRDAVKSFVNYLLGGSNVPTRWTADHGKRFDEDHPKRLSREYPIKVIRPQIMTAMPILQDILNAGFTWADLQYIESCIMTEAVHKFATVHGVCSLPLHDSIRVCLIYKDLAESCLSKAFHRWTGITPYLKLK